MKTKLASLCLKLLAFTTNENRDTAQGSKLEGTQLKPVQSTRIHSYSFRLIFKFAVRLLNLGLSAAGLVTSQLCLCSP